MLGLRQEIACHKLGIGAAVGNNHHLRRSGGHVDCHAAAAHLHLGFHHKTVAGTKDFRHLRNAFGAVSHGGNGLCPTRLVYFVHAGHLRGIQYGWIDATLSVGRSAKHYAAASGNACRNGEHKHSGEERRVTSGNIQPHAVNCHCTLATHHAGHNLYCERFHLLGRVESANIVGSHGNGIAQIGTHQCGSFVDFGGAHAQIVETTAVETFGIATQSGIAIATHLGHNFGHNGINGLHIGDGALHQRWPFAARRIRYNAYHNTIFSMSSTRMPSAPAALIFPIISQNRRSSSTV